VLQFSRGLPWQPTLGRLVAARPRTRAALLAISCAGAYLAFAVATVALALYVFPSDDDFAHWNLVHSIGSPLVYAATVYQTWSGRFGTEFLNALAFADPDLFGALAVVPAVAFAAIPLALLAALKSFDVPDRRCLPLAPGGSGAGDAVSGIAAVPGRLCVLANGRDRLCRFQPWAVWSGSPCSRAHVGLASRKVVCGCLQRFRWP